MVHPGKVFGALASLAVMTGAAVTGFSVAASAADPGPATATAGARLAETGRLSTSEVEPGRYELLYSGKRLVGRSEVEHFLLYRAALLAREKGATSFSLLYLPGEEGPGRHPAPTASSSGPDFGHWQPHWSYYVTGLGWQPWHPEWGAAFWADTIEMARVEKYEVHAIIRLGDGDRPEKDQPEFGVNEVVETLGPRYR
ncbi:MAG: hypothetical protein LOX97_10230 [Sphingomonas sp.]|nr:hypothetical protein [Sphingomonas sp.]